MIVSMKTRLKTWVRDENGGILHPRPLIKTIVEVVKPQLGNKVYDGAVGSAGFLCEAYDYMRGSKDLTVQEYETLQQRTFYGKEKKSLAYIIGIMNMILHGIEAPNILHTNTLGEKSRISKRRTESMSFCESPFGVVNEQRYKRTSLSAQETASVFNTSSRFSERR